MDIAFHVSLTVHLLSVLGCFGVLAAAVWGLPPDRRNDAGLRIPLHRCATFLLTVGLIAGLIAYVLKIKIAKADAIDLAGDAHMVVGVKFLILIAVGGCLGMGLSKMRRGAGTAGLTWTALLLVAVAAFLGVAL